MASKVLFSSDGLSCRVLLPCGERVLIDPEDAGLVGDRNWNLSGSGYAISNASKRKGTPYAYMHRLICDPADGLVVDHINGDKLDNRRSNLRAVSQVINQANRHRVKRVSASGHRGVYWNRRDENWCAQIHVNGKSRHIGFFPTIELAVQARAAAEQSAWGLSCTPYLRSRNEDVNSL